MLSASATEILNNISKLLENEDIRVNLTASGKAALITGLCTMAGGMFAGNVGVTVGSLAGTLINSYLTPSFVPLSQVVQRGLDEEEKNSLAQLLQSLVRSAPGSGVAGAITSDRTKAAAIQAVMGFVQRKGLVSSGRSSPSCKKC